MNYIDLLLVLMAVGAGFSGYRRGLVTAALSLAGAVAGALGGLQVAPLVAAGFGDQILRIGVSGLLVVIGIVIGQIVGSRLGSWIMRVLRWRPIVALDRGLGMIGQMAGTLAVAWLVALPLAAMPVPVLSAQLRSSAILGAVNAAVPDGAAAVSAQLRSVLSDTQFPPILAPLAPAPNLPVDPPTDGLATDPTLVAAERSILKIRSDAPECAVSLEGTGFVVAPGVLVTNAHVVAGAETVQVETTSGLLSATVVQYNSTVDVAVLKVSGLDAPALDVLDMSVRTGDSAVAAGYPLDGPYTISPMRVRGQMTLRGPDIYGSATVSREVYALRGTIRPGNSGGPLLDSDGGVIGVIFGAAVDDPDVGFALTVAQAKPTIAAGLLSREPADTGSCVTR